MVVYGFTHERTVIKPLGFASWFTNHTTLALVVAWIVITTTYVYCMCMYCMCVAAATSVLRRRGGPLRQDGLERTQMFTIDCHYLYFISVPSESLYI